MAYRSYTKDEPSELDIAVWISTEYHDLSRKQTAELHGITVDAVDYHKAEFKRLSNIDLQLLNKYLRGAMIPLKVKSIKLLNEALDSRERNQAGVLQHVDTALQIVKPELLIQQSEVTHILKDSRDASQDFAFVMQSMKRNAVDAESTSLETPSATIQDALDTQHGENSGVIEENQSATIIDTHVKVQGNGIETGTKQEVDSVDAEDDDAEGQDPT